MPTSPIRRRRQPHLRQAGATYFVRWDVRPGQPPLTEAERGMIVVTVRHFDGVKFTLLAALALEDRVYVLVTPHPEQRLERLIGGWKRWSSWLFGLDGRAVPFWRRGYLDRIMRGPEEVGLRIRQLKDLPGRRWPGTVDYPGLWLRGGEGGRGGEATAVKSTEEQHAGE